MPWFDIIFTDEAIAHLAEHGITAELFREALYGACEEDREVSESSGRPIYFYESPDGYTLAVVIEPIDESTVLAITAYRVD